MAIEPSKGRERGVAGGAGEGAPVDKYGGAAYDPTANVIALVEQLARSTSDLRAADNRFYDAEVNHITEIVRLHATFHETLRTSDLDRLDKTRQVDVLAATASASALATAVQTLANNNDRNAETLRTQLNATAATLAKQTTDQAQVLSAATDSMVKDINSRIAELQKSQYQGVGRSSMADPALEVLTSQVKLLMESSAAGQGKAAVADPMLAEMRADQKLLIAAITAGAGQSTGQKNIVAYISVGISILLGLLLLADRLR